MEELVVQIGGYMLMGGLIAFIIFIAWQFNRFMNALERRSDRKEQEKMHSDG
jgi:flagellar biogenesis protein FliO